MDLILELVVGFVVQIGSEVLGELMTQAAVQGAAHAIQSRPGRYALTCLFGGAIGAVWGVGLREEHHVPRLLWVSLGFAVVAVVLRLIDARGREQSPGLGWRQVLVVPWRWSNERLSGLVFLNLAMAAGILLGYRGH